MSHIHRHALLPFSDQKMFDLVNDVAAYPAYMAGCRGVVVHEESGTLMVATLNLERHGVKMDFTTRNALDAPKSIVMTLHDGPFDELEGRWFFQHLGNEACKVIFDLRFSLASRLTGFAAKRLFDSVGNTMVDAVVQRANEIYGK